MLVVWFSEKVLNLLRTGGFSRNSKKLVEFQVAARIGVAMELGEKVVLLYDGDKGAVTHFAEAFISEQSSLHRVVTKFPWKDSTDEGTASSELVHFKDNAGLTKVSLIVLRQEVSSSACARVVYELFEFLLANAPIQSPGFSLIVPAISRMPGSILNVETSKNVKIYTAFLNVAADKTGVLSHLPNLPPTFALRDGVLAYIIHYVHATGLRTLVFIGPSDQGVFTQKRDSYEVLHTLGDIVARQIGLTCLKEKLISVSILSSITHEVEDDWRRLYI